MKKLAFLTVISTSAIAGPQKFNDAQYLSLSKGDPVAAQEFKVYCDTTNRSKTSCISDLTGGGNLKQEAVSKCMKVVNKSIGRFIINPDELIKRGGLANGNNYKEDVLHKDEWGTHAHRYSKRDRDRAVMNYRNMLMSDALNKADGSNAVASKSSELTLGGSLGISAGIGAEVGVEFSPSSTTGTTITPPKLSKAQLDAINAEAEMARDNPYLLGGVVPTIFCPVWQKECDGLKGEHIPNPFYDPKAKDDSKNAIESKKDDKKGAENPPKHVDDTPKDVPDNVSSSGGSLMAGESGIDVTGIATPTEANPNEQSPMEKCVARESKLLTDELGKKSFDPNASSDDHAENERAKSLLEHGYCDEQIMGHAFCQAKKFKENSVVAIELKEERKEAASQALESFKRTGTCDSNALGREFCKAQKHKWETTPIGSKELGKDSRAIGKPSRSGDIPKINP